jgi:DNA-directed RNA polymerase specialized sigma24 family protein
VDGRGIDWQALFFDESSDWPGRLMARARRRFGADNPDAEAAYNHAFDALAADGWARLDRFTGKGSADGFLAITFLNLMEDYAVRKYGRVRPPVWVQRLGQPWLRIFELLCLQRQPRQRVIDLLSADGHPAGSVQQAVREVKGRIPRCGEHRGEAVAQAPAPDPVSTHTPVSEMEDDELTDLFGVLRGMLDAEAQTAAAADLPAGETPPRSLIARAAATLELSARERLLLRLVYQEQCTIPEAARDLQMNERTARRVHGRLISRLRSALEPLGLTARK